MLTNFRYFMTNVTKEHHNTIAILHPERTSSFEGLFAIQIRASSKGQEDILERRSLARHVPQVHRPRSRCQQSTIRHLNIPHQLLLLIGIRRVLVRGSFWNRQRSANLTSGKTANLPGNYEISKSYATRKREAAEEIKNWIKGFVR